MDDDIVAYVQVEIYRSGALSVTGTINNEAYAVNALQGAIDAVKGHHSRKNEIIVPAYYEAVV